MELLRREKGPSLGHMVAYYGSDEVCSSGLVFPDAVKNGDTAFELAHGMNIYNYMYKIDTPENGRVKAALRISYKKWVYGKEGANSHMIMTGL